MKPMLAASMCMCCLLVHKAHAGSCVPLVADLVNHARGSFDYVQVTVATNQQNSIVSWTGYPWTAALDFDGVNALKTQAPYHHGVLYSDRTATVNSRVQNFDAAKPDFIDMAVAPDGSSVTIKSITWGFVNRVSIQSCDNGVMYGWGNSIGNHNSGLPALYTFSFVKRRAGS